MLAPIEQARTYKTDGFEVKITEESNNKFAHLWSRDGLVGILGLSLDELTKLSLLLDQVIASEHERSINE